MPGQKFRSWDDVKEIAGLGKIMLEAMKVFCYDPARGPSASQPPTSGTGNFVLMVQAPEVEKHVMHTDLGQLMVLWTQSQKTKPGQMSSN